MGYSYNRNIVNSITLYAYFTTICIKNYNNMNSMESSRVEVIDYFHRPILNENTLLIVGFYIIYEHKNFARWVLWNWEATKLFLISFFDARYLKYNYRLNNKIIFLFNYKFKLWLFLYWSRPQNDWIGEFNLGRASSVTLFVCFKDPSVKNFGTELFFVEILCEIFQHQLRVLEIYIFQ